MTHPGSQTKAPKMSAFGVLPFSTTIMNTACVLVNFLKLSMSNGTHLFPQTYSASQPPQVTSYIGKNLGVCVIQPLSQAEQLRAGLHPGQKPDSVTCQ